MSTDSGQPIRAQGAWSMLRLMSSLSVTPLTSVGPRDGKHEEPRATLTSCKTFPRASLQPPSSHFPNLSSQTLLCDHKVCKHMLPLSRGPPHGFFTAVLMLKSTTQKNNEHAHSHAHTFLAQSWSCVTCISLQCTLARFWTEGRWSLFPSTLNSKCVPN